MDELTQRRRSQYRIVILALGLLVVGVAGYFGFSAFATSDRGATGYLVLAALTGFASFFSPCSFPLLLTFLSRRSGEPGSSALLSALRVGMGALTMLAALGLILAAGGATFGRFLQFDQPAGRTFRLIVGGFLIFLGLRQTRLIVIRMLWLDRFASSASGWFDPSKPGLQRNSDFLYGFGYLLAGFG